MTWKSPQLFILLWHARVCRIRHLGRAESSLQQARNRLLALLGMTKLLDTNRALSDWFRRGWQWWRLERRRGRFRRNLGCGRSGVKHGAQRGIASREEIYGIRGKEHNHRHRNQCDQI